MSSLKEDCWILVSASEFSLLLYAVLVKVSEENMTSHKYDGKGKGLGKPHTEHTLENTALCLVSVTKTSTQA